MFKKIVGMSSVFIIAILMVKSVLAEDKLNVVVSLLPQAYLVEQIGKDKVNVSVMIPPGGNPHTYEPTPSQLTNLTRADIYVKVGSGVEFELTWMDKLISFNKNMLVCNSSKRIQLIAMAGHPHDDEAEDHGEETGDHDEDAEEYHHDEEGHPHHHGGQDPHVWLSPNNAIMMASNIRDALIERDPGNEKSYRDNASILVGELTNLKEEIARELSGIKNRNFLVFHPSWGYFAADFNLNQIAVEQEGKDPTPKQLAHLVEEAKAYKAKVILVSPQFSQKSARTIADEIDGRVESMDPLAKDFINNLRKFANILSGKR